MLKACFGSSDKEGDGKTSTASKPVASKRKANIELFDALFMGQAPASA